MNREAAALGVPVYSIFRGKTGAVDRRLEHEGRLVMVRTSSEVHTKILFQHRKKETPAEVKPGLALTQILDHIEDIIRTEYTRSAANGARPNGAQP